MTLPTFVAIFALGQCAIAALQQSAAVASKLGEVGEGRSGAFSSASSRIQDLQTQLTQMEMNNRQQQAQRKAEYEQEVGNRRRENLQVASMNAHIVQEIQVLQKTVTSLRATAFGLRQDVQSLQEDWRLLEKNISAALEVTGKVVKGVVELDKAPELRILDELNRQDSSKSEYEKSNHRFDDILQDPKFALLQVHGPRGGTHGAILAALEAGLRDLTAENDRVLRDLDRSYTALLQAESKRHAGLLSEQKMSDGQKMQLNALAERLQAAVDHLKGLNGNTSHQSQSVRAYFAQVGSRPLPGKSIDAASADAVISTTPRTTATTTTTAHHAREDPDSALFELDALLAEPTSGPRPAPVPQREDVSALEVPPPPSNPQATGGQSGTSGPGDKEWLRWFTR